MIPSFARNGTGPDREAKADMTVDPVAPGSRRSFFRALLYGCLAGALLALACHVVYVLVGNNFHTVIPGQVYRSAQLSAAALERFIRDKHIRTVVNLRGCCDPEAWYLDEGRVTLRNDVSLEDLSFSAGRMPSSIILHQLLEIIDRSDYPILFHCHKGADRTGMASAVALLLRTDTPLEEARQQLGFRYGHLPLGRTVYIDRFFNLYAEWLAGRKLTHSPAIFRRWIEKDYCPGQCRCKLELLEPSRPPLHLNGPMPSALRVRCHNTSIEPWRLHPASNSGTHLIFVLTNDSNQRVATGKAGLFHAVVPPGEFIDLTVVLPGLTQKGRYELRLDMEEEQHAFFLQTGSQPLLCTVEVP
ncbi:MAG TPA: tyrosine-protein phosphatase [Gemmataceae bacterium]|nr:tyrosine-protein phosphatase [Gemmataceae bacterium]